MKHVVGAMCLIFILQVINWFLCHSGANEETGGCLDVLESTGLPVLRVKNRFGWLLEEVPDGYRDVKLFVSFSNARGLGIIGEIQVSVLLRVHKSFFQIRKNCFEVN